MFAFPKTHSYPCWLRLKCSSDFSGGLQPRGPERDAQEWRCPWSRSVCVCLFRKGFCQLSWNSKIISISLVLREALLKHLKRAKSPTTSPTTLLYSSECWRKQDQLPLLFEMSKIIGLFPGSQTWNRSRALSCHWGRLPSHCKPFLQGASPR